MIDIKENAELNVLNHSCAHMMAQAVKRLYPQAKFWVGPVVSEGFYYDMDLGDEVIKDEDLPKIEKEMKKIAKDGKRIVRKEITKAEAQLKKLRGDIQLNNKDKYVKENYEKYVNSQYIESWENSVRLWEDSFNSLDTILNLIEIERNVDIEKILLECNINENNTTIENLNSKKVDKIYDISLSSFKSICQDIIQKKLLYSAVQEYNEKLIDYDYGDEVNYLAFAVNKSKKDLTLISFKRWRNTEVGELVIRDFMLLINDAGAKNGILVIHDTPGANNSRNEKHGNITREFLENSKIDLFIYLINAHNPTTNDNYSTMNNVYEAYNKNKNAKILFLINKVDDFDFESSETIEEIIDTVKKDIESIGFKSPIIIPLSADAARVFRKILKCEEVTAKERASFSLFYNIFEDERMNLPSYYKDYKLYDNTDNSINTEEEYIMIKDNKYSTKKINDMLNKTSINLIRNIINKEINGSKQ